MKAWIIIEIWPLHLFFGVNAGVKSLGPDQIYNICFILIQYLFYTVSIMPDSRGILCLLKRIEITELLKGHGGNTILLIFGRCLPFEGP